MFLLHISFLFLAYLDRFCYTSRFFYLSQRGDLSGQQTEKALPLLLCLLKSNLSLTPLELQREELTMKSDYDYSDDTMADRGMIQWLMREIRWLNERSRAARA